MSACTCANYDSELGRFCCSVSGGECVFLMPNSKSCAESYDEGPEAGTLLQGKEDTLLPTPASGDGERPGCFYSMTGDSPNGG